MRLAEFILSNVEPILVEWEAFARGIAPAANMDSLALRDHAEDILRAIAHDMRSTQSAVEQSAKSKGRIPRAGDDTPLNGASETHAVERLGSGFDLLEVVSEYRALRASVLELWRDSRPGADERHVDDLTRFNESIDQSVTKAVSSYTKRVDQARDLFLAILSHDLRNPLNSIAMSAELLPRLSQLNLESSQTAAQISTSAQVMARMISDLLDYTRTRLGAGMPVSPVRMDLAPLCRDVFQEFRSAHPSRAMNFDCDGDTTGDWDADRLRQAVSNLMGNAVQHGDPNGTIDLSLVGKPAGVVLAIRNDGAPIPPGELSRIFQPLVRGAGDGGKPKINRPGSIGLGLYIAREIAKSHGGNIDVISTAQAGTTFTIRLPREYLTQSGQPILDEMHVRKM